MKAFFNYLKFRILKYTSPKRFWTDDNYYNYFTEKERKEYDAVYEAEMIRVRKEDAMWAVTEEWMIKNEARLRDEYEQKRIFEAEK